MIFIPLLIWVFVLLWKSIELKKAAADVAEEDKKLERYYSQQRAIAESIKENLRKKSLTIL